MADDALSDLLAFRWRDVQVPVTRMRVSLAHDLVEHKYWGVDGARVEATGLAPLRFSATIPMVNGLAVGKSETWKSQLYTNVLRPLIVAFSRRDIGLLQHPEFGNVACKAERLDIDWDGSKRGGCDVEASWVETVDDRAIREVLKAPASAMGDAARTLDASGADIKSLVPKAPVYVDSFESMMNNITGVVDQVGIQSKRAAGRIDAVVYRVKALGESVDRTRSSLTWPIKHAIEVIKANADDLRKALAKIGRDIVIYTTLSESTMAGVYGIVGGPATSMTEFIRLNSHLMREPRVPVGSNIRYFASSIA